jgi:RsiW-degrading membrane proteinase PrsW (M82 family)
MATIAGALRRAPQALVLFALAAIALALAGCGLPGTDDVALDLGFAAKPAQFDAVRDAVRARLAAGRIGAEVDLDGGGRLRVTLDQGEAESATELLRWKGGLAFYRVDDAMPFAPRDTTGLRAAEGDPGERGPVYVGEAAAIRRAMRETKLDPAHRALVQTTDAETSRVRVVLAEPVAELTTGIVALDTADGGRGVAVVITPEERARIGRVLAAHQGERIAVGLLSSALAVGPIVAADLDPLLLDLGDDIHAYARAQSARRLLSTPPLPELRAATDAPLPRRYALAVACVVLPALLSLAWLHFVARFDRAHPEPRWLVLATFALGALAAIPAGYVESLFGRVSPWLDPHLATLGGQPLSLPLALVVFTVVVGVVEEGAKLLGAWVLAAHRREFDEPIDGIVYAAASAFGFAALENARYFADGRLSASLVAARAFTSVPAHLFFATLWGAALGQKLVDKRARVGRAFLVAAVGHGAFDTFLSIDGLGWLALPLFLGLAAAFVTRVRRALRYGVAIDAPSPSGRALFPVGSKSSFAVSVATMLALAFALFVLGAFFEAGGRRVDAPFVVAASVLLFALGLAARATTLTMPLDVALDARGVTFGGAFRAWADVRAVSRRTRRGLLGERGELWLETTEGSLRLGPGSPAVLDRLTYAVTVELARRRDAA